MTQEGAMSLQTHIKGETPRPPDGNRGGPAADAPVRARDARQARFARSFTQIVAVLMRDRNFGSMPLADLEWLVLPPVMAGQFKLAQAPAPLGGGKAREGGVLVPVAVALWARVSDGIDKALSDNLDKAVRLKPSQWASGDNIWLVAAAGDRRAVPKLIDQLANTELKGQRIKMRVRGADSKVVVKTLGAA
jgi:cytolysin-activating lysine-acyltransferase